MYAARTGYRQAQDEHMSQLEAENTALRTENAALKARIAELERREMKKRFAKEYYDKEKKE